MIILNETREAEKIIEQECLTDKIYYSVMLLTRYYYHKKGMRGRELYNTVTDFMRSHCENYDSIKWGKLILKIAKQAKERPLTEIMCIKVTKSELNKIKTLKTVRLKRLAFTLLCLAKFNNSRNSRNNNWVSQNHKDIFAMADIRTTNGQQALMLNDLECAGLISFSQKVDNVNIRVDFIDTDGRAVLMIQDFRHLGTEYMASLSPKFYSRCLNCGQIFKISGRNHKYCSECTAEKFVK